jgi:asparagine synthase (glutamine-hydrolysing)
VKELLAVSVVAGREHTTARRAARHLGHPGDVIVHHRRDGWLAFSGPASDDRLPDGGAEGFTVRLTRSSRAPDGDVGTARLAQLLGAHQLDGEALSSLLPPFAAAHQATDGAPTVLAGDWLGLRALFWWQSDGIAAVSTSALALAALAEAGLDLPALGQQSLLGWQAGLTTGYQGVTKLAPGCVAVLHRGRVSVRPYAEPTLAPDRPAPRVDTVVEELANILRDFHQRYLADHPKTVLQLSGGQDSRMILCAVPADLRPGLRALTLDVHGGKEASVASRLRDACGLSHEFHWVDDQPPVDPSTAHRMTVAAAATLNGLANPLARAALVQIESNLEQGHRLTGTGGETGRGFYYPGQPKHDTTSDRLVRRLADWRLFTNEAVEPAALDQDFAERARAAAIAAVTDCFAAYQPDWLRATDEFYLWQRVQRWAGAHDTAASVDRQLVNPLLDRRFVRLMLATSPSDRRHSALAGRLMRRLSPELAAIPFDSGLVPARLARGGTRAGLASARATAGKTASKLGQRLRGTRRNQLGAAELAGLVVAHWRANPDLVRPVGRTGVVRESWLDELLDGRREALPATVAFLVNLSVLAEAVS